MVVAAASARRGELSAPSGEDLISRRPLQIFTFLAAPFLLSLIIQEAAWILALTIAPRLQDFQEVFTRGELS